MCGGVCLPSQHTGGGEGKQEDKKKIQGHFQRYSKFKTGLDLTRDPVFTGEKKRKGGREGQSDERGSKGRRKESERGKETDRHRERLVD